MRRLLLALAVAVMLAAPLAIPASHVLARTLAAYATVGALLRVIEVTRGTSGLLDPRTVGRARPRVDIERWLVGLALGAISVALLVAAHALRDGHGPYGSHREIVRAIVGAGALLAGAESSARLLSAGAAVAGFELPLLHVSPSTSRTLAEFWGKRWNRLVGGWLRSQCYLPLARVGAPRIGVAASFAASALIHVYPTVLSIGAGPALAMGSFFLAHGMLRVGEARLAVRRWPPIARTAFVCGAFAVTAPLFFEPFLRSITL